MASFELVYGVSSFGFSFLIAYLFDTNSNVLCALSLAFVLFATLLFFLCEPLYRKESKGIVEAK